EAAADPDFRFCTAYGGETGTPAAHDRRMRNPPLLAAGPGPFGTTASGHVAATAPSDRVAATAPSDRVAGTAPSDRVAARPPLDLRDRALAPGEHVAATNSGRARRHHAPGGHGARRNAVHRAGRPRRRRTTATGPDDHDGAGRHDGVKRSLLAPGAPTHRPSRHPPGGPLPLR